MICPYCQSELTHVQETYGDGYECRNEYFYLEEDYPICHYIYREYKNDHETKLEHRYLFYPFVIYSYPEINSSDITYLFKDNDMSHHGTLNVITTNCIIPDFSNLEPLIERLNTYLTFS